MPDDPHRVGRQRIELPQSDYRDEARAGAGAAILLGALLLVAIGGFVFYFAGAGDSAVTTNGMSPPITQPATNGSEPEPAATGSSRTMPAAPENAEPRTKPLQ